MKRKFLCVALLSLILMAKAGFAAGAAQQTPAGFDAYRGVLDSYHRLITTNGMNAQENTGETGVLEAISGLEPGQALASLGYAVLDISGDDIPELLIGLIEETEQGSSLGSQVLAAYTLVDGLPHFTFEGWARNRYYYIGQGSFYHSGSSGAAQSQFGEYRMSLDGKEMICIDFCFTDLKDTNLEELSLYHNVTGKWEKAGSEELDMSQDQFQQMEQELADKVQMITLTPFLAYEAGASPVQARWAKDALADDAAYHEFTVDTSDAQVQVLLSCIHEVKDFKVLALTITGADMEGKISFESRTLYALDSLTPGRPLLLQMTFFGDVPSYGVSYRDERAKVQTFTLSLSGEDGSLLLSRID